MATYSKTSIFLTGATGYIGGAVLAKLLSHPNADSFDITVLVRNAEKAKVLESKFGVKVVVGTLQDLQKIHDIALQSHVVLQLADADDEQFTKVLLSGLKDRHTRTGDVPIIIHTSGTGVLVDNAWGEYATETIYNDLDVDQIKSIPETAMHRAVDLLIVNADREGYIVLPSTIYGIANHALVDAGVSNAHSVQVPLVIKSSLKRKRAGVVGKGVAMWPNVHINDIANLYIVLVDAALNSPDKIGHGWEGFYFGENGEHTWYDIGQAVGEALVALGIIDEAAPTPFTTDEFISYWGSVRWGSVFGSNSRCRAERARLIGWTPKYTKKDFIESILPEVEAFAKL